MRAYQQVKKIFELARTILLLVFAVGMAAQAQVISAPQLPPTQATLPAIQTTPAGFETLGFIEYASVDAMCDAVQGRRRSIPIRPVRRPRPLQRRRPRLRMRARRRPDGSG